MTSKLVQTPLMEGYTVILGQLPVQFCKKVMKLARIKC